MALATTPAADVAAFLAAATAELRGWDVYLERLQVKAATSAGNRRAEYEDAISELRRFRNALAARVGHADTTSGEKLSAAREQVRAARDELESMAAAVEATLHIVRYRQRGYVDPLATVREREVQP